MSCGCDDGALSAGPAHVFTARDDSNYTVIWLTAPMALRGVTKLAVRYYIGAISGNMAVKLVYGYGSNPFALTEVLWGSDRTASGWYPEFTDEVEDDGIFYQFGVAVKNSGSESNAESALIEAMHIYPTFC